MDLRISNTVQWKTIHFMGAMSSIGICYHHYTVFVVLVITESEIKQTLNPWLFQVFTDYHIKIKLPAQVSVLLVHIMVYI